jgi:hypothetical protein
MFAKSLRLLTYTIMVAICVAGCGEEESSGPPSLQDSATKMNRAMDDFVAQFCECYADDIYNGDLNTCQAAESPDEYSLPTGCNRDVIECYSDDFRQFANCYSAAISELTDCFAFCPETQTHMEHCESQFDDALEKCALDVPTGMLVGSQQCDDGETFVCSR